MKQRLLIILCLLFSIGSLFAQNFNMGTNVRYSTCAGNFYDSGGPSSGYGNNLIQVTTICPDVPGSASQIGFSQFDLQNNADFLYVYDGESVNAPLLGTFTGSEIPLAITATSTNTSGCLTFRFVSDNSVSGAGWVAQIQCVTPCQSIVAQIANSFPARNQAGIIKTCINDMVTLNGSAVFGTSSAGATYTWDMGNGVILTGQNITYAYPEAGVYRVNLVVRDPSNCRNSNSVNQIIQVSTRPVFASDVQPEYCFGEDFTITAAAIYEGRQYQCAPPVSGVTFLPDGSGASYATSISVDCYEDNQRITSLNDLLSICINMEHSYLGDLSIRIVSPNGTVVSLKDYPGGGGTYLGHPWDNEQNSNGPGIGETYCFTPDATQTLVQAAQAGNTKPAVNTPGQTLVPGDYKSSSPLDALIGSPLNGVWTLQITDHLGQDDGYIFSWGVSFNPDLTPPNYAFTPVVETSYWLDAQGNQIGNGNAITLNYETAGQKCITYVVVNDFNCTETKQICFNILPEIVIGTPRNFEGCADASGFFTFDFLPVYNDLSTNQLYVFSLFETEQDAKAGINEISTTQSQSKLAGLVTYWVRIYNIATDCTRIVPFTAIAKDCSIPLVPLPDLSICEGQENSFDLTQYDSVVYYNNLDYNVVYYNSEEDAVDQLNPISDALASNYVATSGETIWVRVTNNTNVESYGITSFKIFIFSNPEVFELTPLIGCEIENTGLAKFNLSLVIPQATGMSSNIEISFFGSEAEAIIGNEADRLPSNYTAYQGVVYVRAYNPSTGCFSVMPLQLRVLDAPIANEIAPLQVCDLNNDGYGVFNIAPTAILIAGNPIPQGILVTYHETLGDATNNVNRILNLDAYNNIVANVQTIYVRVGYINSTCASIVPLKLIVKPTPEINEPTPLHVCGASVNGIANFDLTLKNSEILGDLNPFDYLITYHITGLEAEAGTNQITNPTNYSNLTSSVVFVRVQDKTTGCYKVVKLSLIIDQIPSVIKPIPTYQLCDDNFDGFQVFDLASKVPSIVGNQTGLEVTFYYTNADANSKINPLVSPYQNVVQNVQTIYVRVENVNSGCYAISTMDIRVNPMPVLNTASMPFEVCSNTDTNFGTVDLTSFNNQLLNGGPNYDLKYFETEANANNNLFPIPNPTTYNNLDPVNPSVWVRATNVVTGCSSVYRVTFKLVVSPKMPLTLPDLVECDVHGDIYNGITPIDLTQQTQLILDAQVIPADYTVRYYTSESLANAGVNWIANPEAYLNATNPQTFWVRIHNDAHPNSCFMVKSFKVKVNLPLELRIPQPIVTCDNGLPNDQRNVFDLTSRALQITQGEVFGVTLNYYESESEANARINPIANPEAYTNISNPQTVWVVVENMYGCFSSTTLTIRVLPLPEPNLNPSPLQVCETELGSHEGLFDLTSSQLDLSNGNRTLTYKFFITEEDAFLDRNAINTDDDYLAETSTIYVRVSNNPSIETESCFVVVPLQLIVNRLPQIGPMTPLLACVERSRGFYTFNLKDKDQQALAGQNPANFTVRYYIDENAANEGLFPLPFIYTNVVENIQTIYVRVQNNSTGCYSIARFQLKVEEKVFAYPPSASLVFCDTDGVNDGFGLANISSLSAGIISTQPLTDNLAVRYYTSWANYNARIVSSTTAFPITNNPQLVIAEVFNTVNGELCTATVEFYITMSKAPSFETIPNGYVCVDLRTGAIQGYLMDTGLKADDYSFTWMKDGAVLLENGPSYVATAAGNYLITVTSRNTGCSYTQSITVSAAPAFTIDQINITDGFADTNGIEVIAVVAAGAQLEYALDEGAYQDSNFFLDVSPGTHTVWVKVKGINACAISKVVTVLNYPKFFTPNNDGYNDTWNIWALKQQPEAKIYIFDRQGKLLKQISPNGEGWDGTFNGQPLPSTDYWFKAEFIEPNTGLPKEARGHFSLKR